MRFHPLMSFSLAHQTYMDKTGDHKTSATAQHPYNHQTRVNRDSSHTIFGLQQAIGNQAVQTLMRSGGEELDFSKVGVLQPKLKVSQPNDVYEQEADRVAEQVMRMTVPSDSSVMPLGIAKDEERIDRKCTACEMKVKEDEEKQLKISRKPSTAAFMESNDEFEGDINNLRHSGGSPLDTSTKHFMESRFGYDFGDVRIHTDERAAESANSINALAYTIGNDIVFGEGQYRPNSLNGRSLLTHELAHVVQQNSNRITNATQEQISSANACVQIQEFTDNLLHRFGDPTKIPRNMSCPVGTTSPSSVIENIIFDGPGVVTLSPLQITQIKRFVDNWHALGGNIDVRVDGFASVDGKEESNWTFSCKRAEAVKMEMISPSDGTPGIPASFITFFAHGKTDEFSASHAPNRRATISAIMPAPPPAAPPCDHPGDSRTLDLQPVFFKSSAADPNPTGTTWNTRFNESNAIWGKLGVRFTELSRVEIVDAANKTAGSTLPEVMSIFGTRSGSGIEVFMVDNDMAFGGGGATIDSGTSAAKMAISDRGTSNTLLAHELGHVLGIDHPGVPPNPGDPGTIMVASGSNSSPNPTKNTMVNFARITFPAPTGSTCLNPDP